MYPAVFTSISKRGHFPRLFFSPLVFSSGMRVYFVCMHGCPIFFDARPPKNDLRFAAFIAWSALTARFSRPSTRLYHDYFHANTLLVYHIASLSIIATIYRIKALSIPFLISFPYLYIFAYILCAHTWLEI